MPSIIDHYLVPKHRVLSKEEIERELKEHGLTKKKLPKIKSDDAVVQELEAKKGDVLEITRRSPTAEKAIYFRVVV